MIVDGCEQARTVRSGLKQGCQFIVLGVLFCVNLIAHADQGPLLAAASSLRSLWPPLMQSYTRDTDEPPPRVSFASSGLLSTQILNGAPFQIFLSADLASVNRLPGHRLQGPPELFAYGELSLVVPAASPLADSLSMISLAAALAEPVRGKALRIAIPNPVHAPYGKAAQEALENTGIWPPGTHQLLAAENAAQTLQYVKSGAVAAAIVPRALLPGRDESIVSVALSPAHYQPVQHVVALLQNANRSAQAFRRWLLSDKAQQILEGSGLQGVTRQ